MEIKRVEMKAPTYEAVQVTEDNFSEVADWVGGRVERYDVMPPYSPFRIYFLRRVLNLNTNSKTDAIYLGQWVIRVVVDDTFQVASEALFPEMFRDVTLVRCQTCKVDKPFGEMARRTDGLYAAMCNDCEAKELEEINERREELRKRRDPKPLPSKYNSYIEPLSGD